MGYPRASSARHDGGRLKALIATFLAALLVVMGLQAPTAANAADMGGGIDLTVDYGSETLNGKPVVTSGVDYLAELKYETALLTPGLTMIIDVPDGVGFPGGVPGGNEAIEKIVVNGDGDLEITFKDDLSDVNQQGAATFKFRLAEPIETSEIKDFSWSIGDSETKTTVVVKDPDDEFFPGVPDNFDKSVGAANLNAAVTRDADGVVTVNENVVDIAIPYTITIDSDGARALDLTDEISEYLAYDAESFTAEITTWDENGLNKTVTSFDLSALTITGQSFALVGADLPAGSKLSISYNAHVNPAKVADLQAALQQQADDVDVDNGGNFSIEFPNTATLGDETRTGTITIGGNVPAAPKPGYGAIFKKSSSLSGTTKIKLDDEGNLLEPVDVTYTLGADLTGFAAFADTKYALTRNVVVTDTLVDGIQWAEDDFLAVTSGGLELQAAASGVSDEDFASDEFIGYFRLSDDGKTLAINLGRDVTKNHTITAQARITSIAGLNESNANTASEDKYYGARNVATYAYGDGAGWEKSVDNRLATPKPDYDSIFSKTSSITETTMIELDDDGNLLEPLDVTYTLGANLTGFAGVVDTSYELTRNVVVTDTLVDGIEWASTDENFLVVGSGDLELQAAPSDVSDEDFVSDEFIGYFRVTNDGKTLEINVGHDIEQDHAISAKALITSVAGMEHRDAAGLQEDQNYTAPNAATFTYDDAAGREKSVDNTLVTPMPNKSVIDDPSEFTKEIGDLPKMTKGEAYLVPFTFTVADGAVVNLAESRIIDEIDDEIFDVSDLDAIKGSISGSYAGSEQGTVTGADFDLELNEAGELVFTTSDSFGENLPEGAKPAAGEALTESLTFTVQIPTYVIGGKQTIEIENVARVEGNTKREYTWTSTASDTATSYGDELEVAKTIYRGSGEWTKNLRVEIDENGDLVQHEFIYRVQLIPHGTYNYAILPIADILPEEMTLLGFVSDSDLESGSTISATTVDMGHGVQAVADLENGTVRITQASGRLEAGLTPYVNFKVHIDDFTENVGIRNSIGNSTAIITPSDGYPLSIAKADSEREDVLITDRDARFTVTGPDGEDITKDAYVVDGQLVVKGEDGADQAIVIPENADGSVPAGRYTITETVAPEGYVLSESELYATIREDGSSDTVTFYNTPESLYAIGDYTWIDTNRDGIQDADEPVLTGVTVELLDADGEVIRTTTTDTDGRYLFDLLPEGDYKVRFTLTDEQSEIYVFTAKNSGSDVQADSDADRTTGETGVITLNAENAQLVEAKDYADGEVRALEGIDPTWDAGVVEKTYAIGDYTWIDANRDGIQDEGEPVLPGVTVDLLDADGQPAVDIFGDPVAAVETDENGHYLFDNLPAGEYQVRFTLTEEQSKAYLFTTTEGDDLAANSDAVVQDDNERVGLTISIVLDDSNTSLTTEYDREVQATQGIDPTWDAGVVERTYAIGDLVWIDENSDGIHTDDEPVLPGVTVELLDASGEPILDEDGEPVTTTTDENGLYLFDELPAGEYTVKFTLAEEQQKLFRFTQQNSADDETVPNDSNADSDGMSRVIVLGPDNGQVTRDYDREVKATQGIDPTWDAGVVRITYAIGDYTWIDANRDGLQSDDEPVLPGVTVELLNVDGTPAVDASGNPVPAQVTDEDGRYLFDKLSTGEYQVRFTLTEEQRTKYVFTNVDAGDDDVLDSDAGATEKRFVGLTQTITLDGSSSLQSAVDYGTDFEATEGIDPTWDAGVIERTYAIGDYVWIDANRDGLQGDDEKPLDGVTVALLNADGTPAVDVFGNPVAPVQTENGRYLFDQLPAGEYQVQFTLTDEQKKLYGFTSLDAGDDAQDSDADPATGLTITIVLDGSNTALTTEYDREVLATEGIDPTWDAGVYLRSVEVGDYVWIDENRDGRQDDGEPGIPGVVLVITGPDGEPVVDVFGNPVEPQVTDENGRYLFPNLPVLEDGQHYTVTIDRDASEKALEGFLPTQSGQGDREGDSSEWSAQSEGLTEDGQRDLTLDFGFVRPVEPTPDPEEPTPAPEEPTPAPEEPTPAPEEPTPAPEEPTPAPEEPTPAPEEPTPAPEEPTPAPEEPTPAPEEPTPAPEESEPAPVEPEQTPAPEDEQGATPAPEEEQGGLSPTGGSVVPGLLTGALLLIAAAGALLWRRTSAAK